MEVDVALFENERDTCDNCVVFATQFRDVAGLNVEQQLVLEGDGSQNGQSLIVRFQQRVDRDYLNARNLLINSVKNR